MALHVAKEVSGGRAHASACSWQGKCLDLSKAYKQLAIHPAHRPLSVIAVREADGRDALYVSNSLMFGSTAAVYAFNRVSRALWYLINRLLWIPSGVFYDDFPLLSPTASAENADATVSAFLDALGWQHAKTGAKGRPFAHEFDVLGMCHTYIYIYTQLHIHTPCYMPLYKPRGSEALMQASRALNHVYHNQEP